MPACKAPIDEANLKRLIAGALLTESGQPADRISDTSVPNYIARRNANGTASYAYWYRAGGKRRLIALPMPYPPLKPEDAVREICDLAGRIARGEDPLGERKAERVAANVAPSETVEAVCRAFLASDAAPERSADRYRYEYKRSVWPFELPDGGTLGALSVRDLKPVHINKMLDAVEARARRGASRGGKVVAQRTLHMLSAALTWCELRGDFEGFRNPINRGMRRAKERERQRALDAEELRDVWRALDEGEYPAAFVDMMRTMIYTGQRIANVCRMHSRQLKDDGLWKIPAAEMKGKRPHTVAVAPQLAALLARFGNHVGYLFSPDGGTTPIGWSHGRRNVDLTKPLRDLHRQIATIRAAEGREPMEHWTPHDLRRSMATIMCQKLGVAPHVAEAVLAHQVGNRLTRTYIVTNYFDEQIAALNKWAVFIDTHIKNPPPKPKAKLSVVPLRQAV